MGEREFMVTAQGWEANLVSAGVVAALAIIAAASFLTGWLMICAIVLIVLAGGAWALCGPIRKQCG